MTDPTRNRWLPWVITGGLAAGIFALRAPTFGFRVWNVDEAIHAAVARTLLDGGVLYRDAIDQRTPFTYYAVAALFKVGGANNVWAMHALAAGLIALTSAALFLLGRAWRGIVAGIWAGGLFAVFSSALFYPGDAYALHTEWFVAAFASWAAWAFWQGRPAAAGGLLGLAFLSKQPALLDLGAPIIAIGFTAYVARAGWSRLGWLLAGFAAPIAIAALYLALHGAWAAASFYAWTYNLAYYGPEVTAADRLGSALKPFGLLAANYPLVLVALLATAGLCFLRILQRQPTPAETPDNPRSVYALAWLATALAGAMSGGRGYDHYFIQFLPPACLLAGHGLAAVEPWARAQRHRGWLRPAVFLVLGLVVWQLGSGVVRFRARATQPVDPSVRVAEYIRAHSTPEDRVFVWGYHPDIYLFSDRRPASRFVYASFLSGLIPWTNVAPERDTAYAIVPGARETLLTELAANPPLFIVDCSAGPNRHWQKYPLETFPALHTFVNAHYRVVEGGQFVPQGFRLYQRQTAEALAAEKKSAELSESVRATLGVPWVRGVLVPVEAAAVNGAAFGQVDGRAEYFAHAPSRLVYRVPAGATALRGGFGIRAAAYADTNPTPTDGAEFVVTWRPTGGAEQVLLRRMLRPREIASDRGVQALRTALPNRDGGELILAIEPGPAANPASDWTFWSDLLLETAP